jgi:hypothetical protein
MPRGAELNFGDPLDLRLKLKKFGSGSVSEAILDPGDHAVSRAVSDGIRDGNEEVEAFEWERRRVVGRGSYRG